MAVTQPMAEPDGGHYVLRSVTFRVMRGPAQPGHEILLGFQPGFVHQEHVDTVWSENRNEAHAAGVVVSIGSQANMENWDSVIDSSQVRHDGSFLVHYFVDTLDVTMDLRRVVEDAESLIVRRTRMWERRADEVRAGGEPERVPYFEELAKRETPEVHRGVDALVEASVECVFDNASRSHPPIRHLRLQLLAPWDFKRFTGVHPVRPARKTSFPF